MAEALYERPWMRKSADIDILVRPEDANLVLQRFRDAGYVYNGGKAIGEEDFCLNYQSGHPDMTLWHGHAESLNDSGKTRKPVEVHVTPFKISNSISFSLHSKTTAELISRQRYIKVRETIFPVLGHTDELIALVHHFAKHAAQQMTVFNCSKRQEYTFPIHLLKEIALYIEKFENKIDKELAEELILHYHMTEEFRFANRMLVETYGVELPFPISKEKSGDVWECLYAALNGLSSRELLSLEVYSRMQNLRLNQRLAAVYQTPSAEESPKWIKLDESYKFAGSPSSRELPIYSMDWSASRDPSGLRVSTRIPLWQIDEFGSLALRVQLGGDDCSGCANCLKNYALRIYKSQSGIQTDVTKILRNPDSKSLEVPTADPVDISVLEKRDHAEVNLLFLGEHRSRLPFNIGLSVSRSRTGEECDSDIVLMWTKGTSFPFSCLLLGEIR